MEQDMTASEVTETGTSKIWLGDDGIVRLVIKRGSEETLDTAKKNIAAIVKVSGVEKKPLLVDLTAVKSANREAIVYYTGEETTKSIAAVAMLTGSPVGKVLANFSLRFWPAKHSIKSFALEGDAIEWLKGFLK